ncbi:MAG: carboxypeptidase-like regulatory domain-containing protein [Candidatus Acidiferrales bacterium]
MRLEYKGFAVKATTICGWLAVSRRWATVLAVGLLWAAVGFGQGNSSSQSPAASAAADQSGSADKSGDKPKPSGSGTVKLRIQVTDARNKPVGNASVYVRYYTAGGFLRHEKLEELDLKTNQDGSVKVPEIPQGKILIQVIAKGWRTYGKWYEIEQEEEDIPIKLDSPPHWY